jgi:hypothetical protein
VLQAVPACPLHEQSPNVAAILRPAAAAAAAAQIVHDLEAKADSVDGQCILASIVLQRASQERLQAHNAKVQTAQTCITQSSALSTHHKEEAQAPMLLHITIANHQHLFS